MLMLFLIEKWDKKSFLKWKKKTNVKRAILKSAEIKYFNLTKKTFFFSKYLLRQSEFVSKFFTFGEYPVFMS